MKVGLIATLGTRDITINREALEEKFGHEAVRPLYYESNGRQAFLPRPGGLFLHENFNQIFGKLKFPIIQPALEWLYRKRGQVDTIILVGTDQPTAVPDKYRNNDTLHFAEVLKELIPVRYKDKQQNFDIRVTLIEEDVIYLDSMYSQVSKIIRNQPFTALQQYDFIYLLNQGGIDAINTSLLLNGLNVYGNRLHLLNVNEGTGFCNPLGFPEQYLKENTRAKLESYLKTFNYPAIKYLEVSSDIKALAAYAEHRLNFDFEQAAFEVSHLRFNSWRDQLGMEVREINQDEFELLREVYLNARIKFDQEAYVDFLFRIFRIVEGLAKYQACKYIGLDFKTYSWKRDIRAVLDEEGKEGLKAFIENYTLGNMKLDMERMPTIPVWIALLEYFDPNTAAFLKKIRRLADLRNQSIGAHSFNPVSLQLIEDTLQEENMDKEFLFEKLNQLFEPRASFDQINQWITQLIDE